LLKLNKVLFHLDTLYLVLNHLLIKCSKEDSFLILTLIDIDWEQTTSKFQSIALIELKSLITKEMDQCVLMEIKEVLRIMSLILLEVLFRKWNINRLLLKLLD